MKSRVGRELRHARQKECERSPDEEGEAWHVPHEPLTHRDEGWITNRRSGVDRCRFGGSRSATASRCHIGLLRLHQAVSKEVLPLREPAASDLAVMGLAAGLSLSSYAVSALLIV
jgi:hypothetical protein